MITRHKTRQVRVGKVLVGGESPISIQSMTNVPTEDISAVARQINQLHDAGCEIARVAVPMIEAARAIADIKKEISLPLVADVHFDHKIALEAVKSGTDKIRINPGNLHKENEVRKVIDSCRDAGIPIRVGANSGSILSRSDRDRLRADGQPIEAGPEIMVEKTLNYLKIFQDERFDDVVVSLKASSVANAVEAYRLFARETDYPLHLGITAAGPLLPGTVKSAIGIGSLLLEGVGDTIRVSLTGDPVEEVKVAREILQALEIRVFGPSIISCPTCARCSINLTVEVDKLEKRLSHISSPIKVALMGCEVNGPGEARDADIGIASGKNGGTLFIKGEVVRKVKHENFVEELMREMEKMGKLSS